MRTHAYLYIIFSSLRRKDKYESKAFIYFLNDDIIRTSSHASDPIGGGDDDPELEA